MIVDPRLLEPFWLSQTMRCESLFFIDRGDGTARATLLFPPVELWSLTTAAGDVVFEAGRDFMLDESAGVVSRTRGSRIPFATLDELYPREDPFVLVGDGDDFHRRQAAATYDHHGVWQGHVPAMASPELPRTLLKLRAGEPLTLSVTGDSISEGYNASGFVGSPPHLPPYAALVAAGLEFACRAPVTLHNVATAGWTSDDGAIDVERVAEAQPDLVIVAYGMNDAGYAEAPAFAMNIEAIVKGVRSTAPDAEFVLVSPMLPNPRWPYPSMDRFPAYRDALARLCGAGLALADVMQLWSDVLRRKSVHDLSGNGINHPNDFGHRLYAQTILGMLLDTSVWGAAQTR